MSGLDAALGDAVTGVTKKWAKQRKAEERSTMARIRRREAFRPLAWTAVEAVEEHIEAAYLKASANGRLWANARQIMYAIRPFVQEMTGKELRSSYFTQKLLPDYLETHPDHTASWKIAYDARGHFREPHTGRNVPLGTIEVQNYLGGKATEPDDVPKLKTSYPTHGPTDRFKAIMFIEKEGFDQLLADAGIAARFDIAIMSTKGMSVTASRELVDRLDVPLLVLHDFDQAGFSIIGTLRRDTRRYRFASPVEVIDLGIRLGDIEAYDLQTEYQPLTHSARKLLQNGATPADYAFLGRHRRVELNAFSSDQFISFIEKRLTEVGVEKVVPDDDRLAEAYRRAYRVTLLNRAIEEASEEAERKATQAAVPAGLIEQVRERLKDDPKRSWDEAVDAIVEDALDDEDQP